MTGGTTPHEIAPSATRSERDVRARNLLRDVANRIHDDEGARPPIARICHTAIDRLPAPKAEGGHTP